MHERDEEEDGVNLDVVRRHEQPREEIRIYMNPPVGRGDGDPFRILDPGVKTSRDPGTRMFFSVI